MKSGECAGEVIATGRVTPGMCNSGIVGKVIIL